MDQRPAQCSAHRCLPLGLAGRLAAAVLSDSAVWWASHALSSSVRPHKGAAVGRGLAELLGAHSARATDADSETGGSW